MKSGQISESIAMLVPTSFDDKPSSFAIYFDKPFVVGDYIVFGDQKGTVEKIGIKTTRLRSLFGEEIIVSNKDLTSSIVQNFRKMKERRVVFNFGVTYDTPTEKLREIPQIIKKIIEEFEIARLDRVHFKKFGDFSLDFEVSFYLSTPDYNKYMDVQQEINLKIMDIFNEKKIEFAFPTQTIYSKK